MRYEEMRYEEMRYRKTRYIEPQITDNRLKDLVLWWEEIPKKKIRKNFLP